MEVTTPQGAGEVEREPGWRPPPAPTTGSEHSTVADEMARGRAARKLVPRSRHGEWVAADDRADPVQLLEDQARTRLPELKPDPPWPDARLAVHVLPRGGGVMASDLAGEPQTGLTAQLCGDAHLSNFGTYAGPDRRLVFSVNDFDETLPGPRSLAERRAVELWYLDIDRDIEEIVRDWARRLSRNQLKIFERNVANARAKDSLRAFAKLTELVDGQPRIVNDPPLIVPIEHLGTADNPVRLEAAIHAVVRYYRSTLTRDRRRLLERYHYVHAARKVVGVGSVGTRVWIVLMLGRDDGDPLFLQMKEAERSVLEPYLGRSEFANHGRRVVEGQRLMQPTSDIMLGWIRTTEWIDGVDRDFYVRQLWDGKGSAPVEAMDGPTLASYGELCGWALARAHARSGDPIALGSYLGSGDVFDGAMTSFGERYADQNERDYEALRDAARSGRITVQEGL